MELWVRSQDKKRLIKATDIYLDEEIEYACEKYAIKCGAIEIGYYTWNRIFEILNEIQDLLDDISDNKIVGCVYQMPKE